MSRKANVSMMGNMDLPQAHRDVESGKIAGKIGISINMFNLTLLW